jgi:hypothetical protein
MSSGSCTIGIEVSKFLFVFFSKWGPPTSASGDSHNRFIYCIIQGIQFEYNYGSAKVETSINQRKMKSDNELAIHNSSNMPRSSCLEIAVMCDC